MRWHILLGALGLAALSLVLFLNHGARPNASTSTTNRPLLAAPGAAPIITDAKSVAVLPFVNMSSDKENEYLSDGITEELLNALARVPGLHVPARTSAFFFKGKNEDTHRIGDLLHVGALLEGSVRRSGNHLRITAQLINVADGYDLWSEEFNRELKEVFAVEDEIARTIVAKLKVTLAGASSQPSVGHHAENIEAWQLYLKGRYHLYQFTREGFNQAVIYFKLALRKQPA